MGAVGRPGIRRRTELGFEAANQYWIQDVLDPIRRAIDVRRGEMGVLQQIVLPEPVISNHRRRFDLTSVREPPVIAVDPNHLSGAPRDVQETAETATRPRPVPHQRLRGDLAVTRDLSTLQHRTQEVIAADGTTPGHGHHP